MSSRSGAAIVAAFATIKSLSEERYIEYCRKCFELTERLVEEVEDKCEGIRAVIPPNLNLVSFRTLANPNLLAEEMRKKNWGALHPVLTSSARVSPSFRCTIIPSFESKLEKFVEDLREVYKSLIVAGKQWSPAGQ